MTDIKPIKTETDYDEALAEIANLMDAELGTPDGDHAVGRVGARVRRGGCPACVEQQCDLTTARGCAAASTDVVN